MEEEEEEEEQAHQGKQVNNRERQQGWRENEPSAPNGNGGRPRREARWTR